MIQPFGGHALIAHPGTPARAVDGVYFTYIWRSATEWRFDFRVKAPLSVLKLPTPVVPVRADGLWRQTCFEVFLLDPASGSYFEFNFSPSGQWAAYRFDKYRDGMRELAVAMPPQVHSTDAAQMALAQKDVFSLFVHFEDTGIQNHTAWRGGVSAVIEEVDGTKSYWALAHPAAQPDFHHQDSFVLELPAPGPE